MGAIARASVDATTFRHADREQHVDPARLARRSISIFSRRGNEMPEPKPTFLEQAAISTTEIQATVKSPTSPARSERQSWRAHRRSLSASLRSPKSSPHFRGTVLFAVPPAVPTAMKAVEEEMPTINQRSLAAVDDAVARPRSADASLPSSPLRHEFHMQLPQRLPLHRLSFKRSSTQRRRDTQARIGVWVDGIARWDPHPRPESFRLSEVIEAQTGLTPLRPSSQPVARPRLSVDIPDGQLPSSVYTGHTATKPMACSSVERRDSGLARHAPSTSSCSSPVDRAASLSSKRSSATSFDGVPPPFFTKSTAPRLRRSKTFVDQSSLSPYPMELSPSVYCRTPIPKLNVDKPLPAEPPFSESPTQMSDSISHIGSPKNRHTFAAPPSPPKKVPTRTLRPAKSLYMPAPQERHAPAVRELRTSPSIRNLDACDLAFMLTAPEVPALPVVTPTLSQAEIDLRAQLQRMMVKPAVPRPPRRLAPEVLVQTSRPVSSCGSVRSVLNPPEQAPAIPKRPKKREARHGRETVKAEDSSRLAVPEVSKRPKKTQSEARSAERAADAEDFRRLATIEHVKQTHSQRKIAQLEMMMQDADKEVVVPEREATAPIPVVHVDDGLVCIEGPRKVRPGEEVADPVTVKAVSAEEVLIRIMSTLTSFTDLFNMAVINKGMYRVFKDNDMALIRQVAFNASPAAWECREWSPPGRDRPQSDGTLLPVPEHTPQTWLRDHRRDQAVIDGLKKLFLARCATTVRPETAAALAAPSSPDLDAAFWRIWCFCKIFGHAKGREGDLPGQLDWLRGGPLAHNQACAATVHTSVEFDMSSVLLNAPEHFARGNPDGLSTEQLFVMAEVWTCMNALLSPYLSRTQQAQDHGVFADVPLLDPSNLSTEQDAALEEWTFHLLTLGPSVVLQMAQHALDDAPTGFALALAAGWTRWSPPAAGGSRASFLKEPAARMYEERALAALRATTDLAAAAARRDANRQRVAALRAEIHLRRQTSAHRRAPWIDMANERPWSVATHVDMPAVPPPPMPIVQPPLVADEKRELASYAAHIAPHPALRADHPPSLLPTLQPVRYHQPALASDVVGQHHAPSVPYHEGCLLPPPVYSAVDLANHTAERAIATIMALGFDAGAATAALRATDDGLGLRVEDAVGWLMGRL